MAPPRHGKSECVSHAFPVWYLNRWPERRVILASHTAELAASFGRKVRNTIAASEGRLRVRLSRDSTAADRWDTTKGGGLFAVGVGGAVVGRGGHVVIVDDPIKGTEAAYSQTQRDAVWDWWTDDLIPRQEPDAVYVLMHQRWHADDLAGRLVEAEGTRWDVMRFPALAEANDPLGRAEGEALWPDRYSRATLEDLRSSVGSLAWSAEYQQRPSPEEGGLFKAAWLETRYETVVHREMYADEHGSRCALGSMLRWVTVDLAASVKATADYTVIATFGRLPSGKVLVLNVDRARREGPDIVPAITRNVAEWGASSVWVERVGFQLALIQEAQRAGLPVRELEADRDKVARALPLTAAMEGRRLLLPRAAPWLDALRDELLSFPVGAHDDQVDALAYGVRVSESMPVYGCPPVVASPPVPEVRRRAFDDLKPLRRPSPFD